MSHQLPNLPYAFDALEPHIDALTMQIHHGKHHQAYITNLNTALEAHPEFANLEIADLLAKFNELPAALQTAVRNNGGGHANHSLFWTILSPEKSEPSAELMLAIERDFGSFDAFKTQFETAAKTRFGSGWAWLTLSNGKLEVSSSPNQDSPLMEGKTPLLGLDVWEHAYYLNYQNRRPDYVSAFWNVVNWAEVSRRFAQG